LFLFGPPLSQGAEEDAAETIMRQQLSLARIEKAPALKPGP
jgi:hypothetical protein